MRRQSKVESLGRAAVAAALRDGRLARPTACEVCGTPAGVTPQGAALVVLHHWRGFEGDAALDVVPLCRRCHARVHAGTIPEPRTGICRSGARGEARYAYKNEKSARSAVVFALAGGHGRPAFMRVAQFEALVAEIPNAEVENLRAIQAAHRAVRASA